MGPVAWREAPGTGDPGIEFLQYAVLGLVQGITEFLPVSSSGHLAVAERLLGVEPPGAVAEVVLHGGTLMATLVFFRREILGIVLGPLSSDNSRRVDACRELALVVVAVVPTVVLAYGIKQVYEPLKRSLPLLGAAFLITTLFLLLTRRRQAPGPARKLTVSIALLVGLSQGLAAVPGISRTGSTVSTALLLGLEPRRAASFSFLIAIPVILAANVVELLGLVPKEGTPSPGPLILGAAVAGATGYLALHLLLRTLRQGWFSRFGFYTLVLGATLLVIGLSES